MFFVFTKDIKQFEESRKSRDEWKEKHPLFSETMTRKVAQTMPTYLGYGKFGLVFKAIYNDKQVAVKQVAVKQVAVKQVKTLGPTHMSRPMIDSEIAMMQRLHHPNLLEFIDAFEFVDTYLIITELCSGGDLFNAIDNKKKLTLTDVQRVARDMLCAVRYMHQMNITHRDLKPENVMLVSIWDGEHIPHVKIIDFGLAAECNIPLTDLVGTYDYMAPEVAEMRPYGKECDLWSIGAVLYTMIFGGNRYLVDASTLSAALTQLSELDVSETSPKWTKFPKPAKNLVRRLLTKDATDRITADQALRDSFIEELHTNEDKTPIADNILSHNFGQFVAMSKLKRLIRYKIAQKLTTSDKLRYVKAFKTHTHPELIQALTNHVDGEIADCCNALNITKEKEWGLFEFIAGVMNQELYNTYEAVNTAFKDLDIDDNNTISYSELANIVGDKDAKEIMSDFSQKGFFNLKEFNLYFKAKKEEFVPPPTHSTRFSEEKTQKRPRENENGEKTQKRSRIEKESENSWSRCLIQ